MTLFLALQLPIYCLEFQICLTILFLIVKHILTAYNTVKKCSTGLQKRKWIIVIFHHCLVIMEKVS